MSISYPFGNVSAAGVSTIADRSTTDRGGEHRNAGTFR